ncbi:MAG: hypothetical protein OIF50_00485 [Flavobacteriaceae bacterium]|nr:hypothetical protein [Flavobacteriaceae bacterium]
MKTFLSIITFFIFCFALQAQTPKKHTTTAKVVKKEVVKTEKKELKIVRVHKNKDYKVIKALQFTAKKKSVLA